MQDADQLPRTSKDAIGADSASAEVNVSDLVSAILKLIVLIYRVRVMVCPQGGTLLNPGTPW